MERNPEMFSSWNIISLQMKTERMTRRRVHYLYIFVLEVNYSFKFEMHFNIEYALIATY